MNTLSMKDIVTSLELSKKLLTLGVKQKSMFHWVEFEKEKEIYKTVWAARELDNVICSAFTVEELFEFLPFEFFKDEKVKMKCLWDGVIKEKEHRINHRYILKLQKYHHEHWECYAFGQGRDEFGLVISETSVGEHDEIAANACAKMLIFLLENGLIKNEEK